MPNPETAATTAHGHLPPPTATDLIASGRGRRPARAQAINPHVAETTAARIPLARTPATTSKMEVASTMPTAPPAAFRP